MSLVAACNVYICTCTANFRLSTHISFRLSTQNRDVTIDTVWLEIEGDSQKVQRECQFPVSFTAVPLVVM
jgi:hypothetical protein